MPFDEFLRTRLFEPLGMKDTAFYVPKEKLSRLALVHNESTGRRARRSTRTVRIRQSFRSGRPAAAGCSRRRWTTRASARCCSTAGSSNGVRILAPRTVEMMRTNHVNPEALKTMAPGDRLGPGLPGGHGCRRGRRARSRTARSTGSASPAPGSGSIRSRTSRSSACCRTRTSAPRARSTRCRETSSIRPSWTDAGISD